MKKILIVLFLILFTLPAFAEDDELYYFKKLDNYISKYQKELILNQNNKNAAFYNLQKEYENIVFEMNTKNINKISQLQCTNYNGRYSITSDNRDNKIKVQKYYNKGVKLYCSEAMSIFIVDYNWLKKNHGSGLTKEYNEWLKYLSNPVSFEEGTLNTDKRTLNMQITKLEKFIYSYPNFIGIEDVKKELNKLKEAR